MSLKSGIIGLPNIGKSSLFNALLQSHQAIADNYPFCTIDPNEGTVEVFDQRLIDLAQINSSKKVIHNSINIIDIAGLVRGASSGLGLGNQFLEHVKSVDALIHVVRCFEDKLVTHSETTIAPLRDIKIIETELILSDILRIEKLISKLEKNIKSNAKGIKQKLEIAEDLRRHLEEGKLARFFYNNLDIFQDDNLDLITSKPVVFVANVNENEMKRGNKYSKIVESYAKENGSLSVIISAKFESDLIAIDDATEKKEYLASFGLSNICINQIATTCFKLLDLITFFTTGAKESRAWQIKKNINAKEAAKEIHSDISLGFIRAEVIDYLDYVKFGSETIIKQKGLLRLEGKDYQVRDGDVINFLFNV